MKLVSDKSGMLEEKELKGLARGSESSSSLEGLRRACTSGEWEVLAEDVVEVEFVGT